MRKWINRHLVLWLDSPDGRSNRTLCLYLKSGYRRRITLAKWKNGERKWLERRLWSWFWISPGW